MTAPQKSESPAATGQTRYKNTDLQSVPAAEKIGNRTNLVSVASEINSAHANAIRHADAAISFARQAGDLLLKAKADLPHGEFLSWVEAHCTVSHRQAQRYMAAALGKGTSLRAIKPDAIKYDTVSHLEVSVGQALYITRTTGNWHDAAYVFPDSDHPGYFHYAFVTGQVGMGGNCSYSKRSMNALGIEVAVRRDFSFTTNDCTIERFPHPGDSGNPFAESGAMFREKIGGRP